jgi:HSP20 family protein
MDRLIGSGPFTTFRNANVFPPVNVSEDQDNYYLHAEIPGIKSDDLDIQADAKSVSIAGKREITNGEDNIKYHRQERSAGQFSRMIALSGEIDSDKVTANLENGILLLTLPKAEAVKPRQITIS